MTLTADFNPFEHLQQTYKAEFNRRVDRFFKDVPSNGDLSNVRSSLKLACRMTDNDNHAVMDIRHKLFMDVIGYSRKNLAVIYGNDLDNAPPVSGHPKLIFIFTQDESSTPEGESPIQHEKSVRLMKYSCSNEGAHPAITKQVMKDIALEIKTQFIDAHRGITYTTGNKSASYTDPDNGFPIGNYLLVNSKPDAIKIYQKICNVIDIPYRGDSHVIVNDPDKPSTTTATAGKATVLGKQVQKRRYRPIAVLRFRSAYVWLGNLVPPVFLIDTTFRNQSLIPFP